MARAGKADERMTAREFLSQAYWLDKRIDRKAEEIARMRAKLEKSNSKLSDMPRGGSGGDWTDADIRVMDEERRIHDEIIELCRIKREIAEAIEAVEDARYRTLLELRYRNYLSFEKIAVEMNYSWRHTLRIHDEALRAVRVP